MERLRLLELRRREAREIELTLLGLLRGIELLQILSRLDRRQCFLRLRLRQLGRFLRAHEIRRDLLAHFLERLCARRLLLLGLEHVESRPVLEHCGHLARLEPRRLVFQGPSVRRTAARDEPELATAFLRGRVLAPLFDDRGEVLPRIHLRGGRIDPRARGLLLLRRRARRHENGDGAPSPRRAASSGSSRRGGTPLRSPSGVTWRTRRFPRPSPAPCRGT